MFIGTRRNVDLCFHPFKDRLNELDCLIGHLFSMITPVTIEFRVILGHWSGSSLEKNILKGFCFIQAKSINRVLFDLKI